MTVSEGTRLGSYEIVAQLGAGAMGEVYRARDLKLGREVAIKLIAGDLAADPERLTRFRREARLLAALNHANIAAIHGLEEAAGVPFLVLELVEGPTLAERLAANRLSIREVCEISRQIAEGLEAAHAKGILHRDLKPANVKVTPAGQVKILDFGLAKALVEDAAGQSKSPTVTNETRAGSVLGTAAYMSPEQARGDAVDKRTDIWAFGCVLYELLTGRRPFQGRSVPDVLAAILEREPDWQALTPAPQKIRDLVRRCLQKNPRLRLHDIADARIEIEETLHARPAPWPLDAAPRKRGLWWSVPLLAALAAGAVVWKLKPEASPPPAPVTRMVVALQPEERLNLASFPAAALSPDGTRLVYAAMRGATTQLYLRRLDEFESKALPGTEGGLGPFFSPGGDWLGFFAGGKLKRLALAGGMPVAICDAIGNRGAAWGLDDKIVFTPRPSYGVGLARVPAAGGQLEWLTQPDPKKGETSHRWPEFLPGGRLLLFTIWGSSGFGNARVALLDLESRTTRVVIQSGANPHYVAPGYLLFARVDGLVAARFDPERMQVSGPEQSVLSNVASDFGSAGVHFSVSGTGSAVYSAGATEAAATELVRVDRDGTARPLLESRRTFSSPRFSPDGRRVAVAIADGGNLDIWIYGMERGTLTRLTFEPTGDRHPVWTADGKRVTFSSTRDGPFNLYAMAADGSGGLERLATSGSSSLATSWSPDGKFLAFIQAMPGGPDVWILPMEGQRVPQPLLQSPYEESYARFSPDGRWLAYVSNESGAREVYVQPFPGPGEKHQVSTGGGTDPVWAPGGGELYYRAGDQVLSVPVTTGAAFTVGTPRRLFSGPYILLAAGSYDVAPDNQSFVMLRSDQAQLPTRLLHLILNWPEELKRRFSGRE